MHIDAAAGLRKSRPASVRQHRWQDVIAASKRSQSRSGYAGAGGSMGGAVGERPKIRHRLAFAGEMLSVHGAFLLGSFNLP